MEKFSVAISVYKNDNPVYFKRALDSITFLQTVKPNEIVLVVDGPVPDDINDVIHNVEQSDYNFKIIRLEKNSGLGNALKICVENCTNELIARMDSDDVAIPNRFEMQINYLNKHKNVDIVGGYISEFIGEENNIISHRIVPLEDTDLKKFLKKRCPFNHMTVMFKKSAVLKSGGYIDWHYNEDYFLWIRMYQLGCVFSNLPKVLVNVRTGENQFARRGGYKYYKSEKKLQKYMLKNKVISYFTYIINCTKRFIVRVAFPNKLRAFIYKKFARKQYKGV